ATRETTNRQGRSCTSFTKPRTSWSCARLRWQHGSDTGLEGQTVTRKHAASGASILQRYNPLLGAVHESPADCPRFHRPILFSFRPGRAIQPGLWEFSSRNVEVDGQE